MKVIRGAEIGSDHHLVLMKVDMHSKNTEMQYQLVRHARLKQIAKKSRVETLYGGHRWDPGFCTV